MWLAGSLDTTVDAAASLVAVPGTTHGRRFCVFQPRRIDWWASAVQQLGTLLFNLSCGNALRVNLTAQAEDQQVWRPDALGSICFGRQRAGLAGGL